MKKLLRITGFTLIELLIVVAIIAILAAIAVPNFLEAQTRAKVSRVKNDQRALATALESYAVDHNDYIPSSEAPSGGPPQPATGSFARWLIPLSTPISYVTQAMYEDPFGNGEAYATQGQSIYFYANVALTDFTFAFVYIAGFPDQTERELISRWRWVLISAGPDRLVESQIANTGSGLDDFVFMFRNYADGDAIYDPTNGTVSLGDIMRTQNQGIMTKATLESQP